MLPLIEHTDRRSRSAQHNVKIHFPSSRESSQPAEGKTDPPELISESGLQIPSMENWGKRLHQSDLTSISFLSAHMGLCVYAHWNGICTCFLISFFLWSCKHSVMFQLCSLSIFWFRLKLICWITKCVIWFYFGKQALPAVTNTLPPFSQPIT